jgi:hypothetical protein
MAKTKLMTTIATNLKSSEDKLGMINALLPTINAGALKSFEEDVTDLNKAVQQLQAHTWSWDAKKSGLSALAAAMEKKKKSKAERAQLAAARQNTIDYLKQIQGTVTDLNDALDALKALAKA